MTLYERGYYFKLILRYVEIKKKSRMFQKIKTQINNLPFISLFFLLK